MTKAPHILVVDDESEIRVPLAKFLERHGLRVSTAADGVQADRVLARAEIDLIVLDIMLPGESGLEIAKRVSSAGTVPVILLSALSDETDRIVGMEIGADDYVCKPFNPRELVARIRAVLRRAESLPKESKTARGVAKFGGWVFDLSKPEIYDQAGRKLELSTSEWKLLTVLVKYPGITLSREQLLDLTKGRDAKAFDRSIDNQVSRLRKKIETTPASPKILLTKWGGGYFFAAEVEWVGGQGC